MRAFLKSEKPSIRISGSPKFSKDVANSFLDFVQKKKISPKVAEDLRKQRFILNIAIFFHDLLKDFFNTIRSKIQKIFEPKNGKKNQKKDQKYIEKENVLGKHLDDVYSALLETKFCTEQLHKILKLYIDSIIVDFRSSTPVDNSDKKMMESNNNDVIEKKTWPSAYQA